MLDIKAFCKDLRIPFIEEGHHHCVRGWVQLHCPFCSGKQGWHLGYRSGAFHCWRCGRLKSWDVLRKLLRTDDNKVIYDVLYRCRDDRSRAYHKTAIGHRTKSVVYPSWTGDLIDQHKLYLASRKFDPAKLVQMWGLRATCHMSGVWSWRIIIPVHTPSREFASYVGRAIRPNVVPKYRALEDSQSAFPLKSLLYGEPEIPNRSNTVIVTEGPTKVWRFGPGAVATLGADWSEEQASRLSRFSRRFIAFDPDKPGRRKAEELAERLKVSTGTTEILDLDSDPADMSEKSAAKLLQTIGAAV